MQAEGAASLEDLHCLTKLDIIFSVRNWTPEEIKGLRARYRLSQPAFGGLIGVTGNYVYLMEKGVKRPGKTMKLLLNYIERDLNEHGKERRT